MIDEWQAIAEISCQAFTRTVDLRHGSCYDRMLHMYVYTTVVYCLTSVHSTVTVEFMNMYKYLIYITNNICNCI